MQIEGNVPGNPEKLHAERVMNEAKWLLGLYYPILLPKEPYVAQLSKMKKYCAASYEGKLRGVHYIFFPEVDGEVTDVAEAMTGVHELVHQWHAETVGAEAFFGFDHDAHISDEELAKMNPYDAFKKTRKRNKEVAKRIVLSDALSEGFAIFIQVDVLERELANAKRLGRSQRVDDLKKARKERKKAIDAFKKSNNKKFRFHGDGVHMMETLHDRLGGTMHNLIDFIQSVNFVHTHEIPFGSPEYQMLVKDPLLLPRLT